MTRTLISSGSPFEGEIGFSRAVRTGNHIEVSGTAPIRDGKTAGKDDAYEQTHVCLAIIVAAVEKAGGKAADITRTRVMLTDMTQWKEAARAHGEVFSTVRPANTFVEVSRFIDPDWLVEIEASAQIAGEGYDQANRIPDLSV